MTTIARILLGAALAFAGISHLTWSRLEFRAQVPPWVPLGPDLVVVLSGIVEIALGLALVFLVRYRVPLGWLAAAFFVLVFPGNIAQLMYHRDAFGLNTDRARTIRLFFQPVLILWALWSTGAWRAYRSGALALLLLCSVSLSAQPQDALRLDPAHIEEALHQMVADGRAAGASVLVWQEGREAYFGAAGFADREAQRPMTRDAIAQIYSMTKPITGVAMMQLWEQGKFGLDDPLARYLPEFASMQVYAGKDPAGAPIYRSPARPIIIRDIMRHTAGFAYGPGSTPVHEAYVKADPLALDIDLAEMGRRLSKVPLLFDPGSQWSYSIAVDVQALLVEKLSGQPFAEYVRQHVLEPLGMHDTAWRQPDEKLPRLLALYRKTGGKLVRDPDSVTRRLNFQNNRLTGGGFGLSSTVDDYMRFARMLLGAGELEGTRILKPSTIRLMSVDQLDARVTQRLFLPSKGSVGFGLDFAVRVSQPQKPEESRGAVGEFFWDGAASTLFWVDPANQLAAVFFVQTMPFDGTLHRDIRAAIYGPNYLGPKGD